MNRVSGRVENFDCVFCGGIGVLARGGGGGGGGFATWVHGIWVG